MEDVHLAYKTDAKLTQLNISGVALCRLTPEATELNNLKSSVYTVSGRLALDNDHHMSLGWPFNQPRNCLSSPHSARRSRAPIHLLAK